VCENLSTKVAVAGHTQHGALVSLQAKQAGWQTQQQRTQRYDVLTAVLMNI